MSNLVSLLLTVAAVAVTEGALDCGYVVNPYITQCQWYWSGSGWYRWCWTASEEGAIPLYYCMTEVDEGQEESKYFMCLHDTVYVTIWNRKDCKGWPRDFRAVNDTEHLCLDWADESTKCDIFYVQTSGLDDPSDTCERNDDDYRSNVWMNGVCFPREEDDGMFGSAMASCSDSKDYRQYEIWDDETDCSGKPDHIYNVSDNDCVEERDDKNQTWVDVIDCGPTERDLPFQGKLPDCSYVTNPQWPHPDDYRNDSRNGPIPLFRNLDEAVCIGKAKREDGSVESMKFICNPWFQLAYVTVWNESDTCDEMSYSYTEYISGYDDFACGENACDYVHVVSSNSTTSPDPDCEYFDDDYDEQTWLTGVCWNDDEEGTSSIIYCGGSTDIEYKQFKRKECKKVDIHLEINSGDCTDEVGEGNWMYIGSKDCFVRTTTTTNSPKGNFANQFNIGLGLVFGVFAHIMQ